MTTRSILLTIRKNDPSGWEYTEPTDNDYRIFSDWVVNTFGANALNEYYQQWDCMAI